jgi:hypothetical protein
MILKPITITAVILISLWGYTASLAQETLPADNPKYKTAHQVFEELGRAMGDSRTRPNLLLVSAEEESTMQVAWFDPRRHSIYLEERAYDLCNAAGA